MKIPSTKFRSFLNFNRVAVLCLMAILGLTLSISNKVSAVSVLSPGDIFIISANSDVVWNGGANSNGFEFVSKVDLDPGTQIYFTDKAWNASLVTPFWRAGGEGALRYTVPAGGITAGTVVRYDDTVVPSLPTSGSSTWDMFAIDDTTGALTLATSVGNIFDPSTSGDNILVFQGSGAAPNFIFGLGWSAATTWISSGIPSTNNSWIPSSLSAGAGTIVTLGSTDNYQYKCLVPGVFSSGFAANLQNVANWNADNTTAYGPISGSCLFDASRPQAMITQAGGQNDPTNNNSINFTITFDQAIDPASFTTSDLSLSGTGSGAIITLTTPDNINWNVNINAGAEGTIVLSLPNNSVTDPNGNPNLTTIDTDNSVLYDTTPPVQLDPPDLASGSDSGSSDSDNTTNDTTPEFIGTCTNGDTVQIYIDGNPVTPTAVCAGGSYSITLGSPLSDYTYSVSVQATDPTGNQSVLSDSVSIIVDTVPPSCDLNVNNGFEDLSPEIYGYTDDPTAIINITIDGNTYLAVNNSGNWIVAAGTIAPNLTIGQTYPVTLECVDIAGNTNVNSSDTYKVEPHIDLSLNLELLTTGLIESGDAVSYRATLTNLDSTNAYDVSNTFFYALVPDVLLASAPFGQVLPVSNPDIECTNMASTIDIDSVWHQYPNSYVVVCGFTDNTNLNPGENVSFDISFTAGANLPDQTTLKMLIYDEHGADPDSDIIDDTANANGDFYGLSINNIGRAVYRIPATPVDTSSGSNPVVPVTTVSLASTGQNQLLYSLAAIAAMIVGVAFLVKAKLSRRK